MDVRLDGPMSVAAALRHSSLPASTPPCRTPPATAPPVTASLLLCSRRSMLPSVLAYDPAAASPSTHSSPSQRGSSVAGTYLAGS